MKIEKAKLVKLSQRQSCPILRSPLNIGRLFSIIIVTSIIIFMGTRIIEFQLSIIRKAHLCTNSNDLSSQVQSFHSQRQFDMVLSYYAEDINFVARSIGYLKNVLISKNIQPRIIVYNKSSKQNNTYLKDVLKVDIVKQLDNLGREGATYLYHIIENYYSLADHTIFTQAGVEGITDTGLADWFSNRLEKQFNSSVAYMPLVAIHNIVVYNCGRHWTGHFEQLVDLWGMLQQTLCPLGGQAVSEN
jgi:hypothetical protein